MARAGRGQAAVESVGITVVIALLAAATALWLVREVHPPAAPPPVVERVTDPLGAPAPAPAVLPRFLREMARSGGGRSVMRFLRSAGHAAVIGVEMGAIADQGFREGLAARLRERGLEIVHDPFGSLTHLPDASLLTPKGLARRAIEQAGDLTAYVQRLRRMPPRAAAYRVGRDLGEGSGDLLVDVGEALLRRGVARRLGGGGPTTPPPAGGRSAPSP